MLTAYLDAVELRMNLGINAFMMTVTHTCRYLQLKGALQIFGVALSQSQRGGGLGRERLEWRQQVVFVGACLVKTTILETKRRFHNSGKSSQCQILCLLSLDPTDCSSKRCCVTPSQSGDEPTYFKLYIPRHVFSSTPRASTNDL